jgi:hypothetical protein
MNHGLKYPTFWVVQLYEKDSYFTSVVADTLDELLIKVAAKNIKTLVACSLPFQGRWVPYNGTNDLIPDVSLPSDWKDAMGSLAKHRED